MAITKIHAVKATISGAVTYICNAEKTDGEFYISSFGTTPESASVDFKQTLSYTDSSDPNLAYHLIQSFAPGEVSHEEAHKIGIELTDHGFKRNIVLGIRKAYMLHISEKDLVHRFCMTYIYSCHNIFIIGAADLHKRFFLDIIRVITK